MKSIKYFSILIGILLVTTLTGCGGQNVGQSVKLDGNVIISVSVAKVGGNMNDIKEPHVIYGQDETDELQTFVEAIQNAAKLPGIVDIATPHYQLTITFKDQTKAKYFLWLADDNGSLMNAEDTHYHWHCITVINLNI